MFTTSPWRPALVGVFLCCLAAPVRADEIDFLPNNCIVLYSVDMAGFVKSKLYQQANAKIKGFEEEMQRSLKEELGFPSTNVSRVTAGFAMPGAGKRHEEFVIIVSTAKPVAAADIKANRKVRSYQKNFSYKEIKVGEHTIYQESYSFDFKSPLTTGRAFCVADKNIILFGDGAESLQQILERDKKTNKLSPNLQAGLKTVGKDSMLTVVMDVTKFPERERKEMIRELGGKLPALENLFDGMQTFTLKGTADDKVKLVATMTCKDAATATDVRKLADGGIVLIKGELKREMDREFTTPEEKEMMKTISKAFDEIKLSTQGAQVNGELTVEPATAISVLEGIFRPTRVEKNFKDIPEDK
jgi:hypothetical protein